MKIIKFYVLLFCTLFLSNSFLAMSNKEVIFEIVTKNEVYEIRN